MRKLNQILTVVAISASLFACKKGELPGPGFGGDGNGGGPKPGDTTIVVPGDTTNNGGVKPWPKPGDSTNVPGPRPGDLCIDKNNVHPNVACPEVFAPVCGCNNQTYKNECDAKRHGVVRWRPGACRNGGPINPPVDLCVNPKMINPNMACPKDLRPVCGCNNVTYHNPCDANRHGVTKFRPGPCPRNDGGNGTDPGAGDGGKDPNGGDGTVDNNLPRK